MPATTGALRKASAILASVALVTERPRRAAEMVAGLQPDAFARSVAFHPRRASSRSRRVGLSRMLIGVASVTRLGYGGRLGGILPAVLGTRRLRLTERQWRIYLAVWLAALAAATGVLAGLTLPKLLAPAPRPSLFGGLVMGAREVPAPAFTLRDQTGAAMSLADLRGRVIALTFLDTQCQNLCPLQASLLGGVQASVGRSAPFDIVVVSVRPDADTPATIAAFASAHGLSGRYHWLTGTHAQLASVWNSYGVGVQVANGDLAHSSVIYLIDPSGYERVGFQDVPDAAAVENDVKVLAAG